jgi:hypothetical protein
MLGAGDEIPMLDMLRPTPQNSKKVSASHEIGSNQIQCDKMYPACGTCIKNGTECMWKENSAILSMDQINSAAVADEYTTFSANSSGAVKRKPGRPSKRKAKVDLRIFVVPCITNNHIKATDGEDEDDSEYARPVKSRGRARDNVDHKDGQGIEQDDSESEIEEYNDENRPGRKLNYQPAPYVGDSAINTANNGRFVGRKLVRWTRKSPLTYMNCPFTKRRLQSIMLHC